MAKDAVTDHSEAATVLAGYARGRIGDQLRSVFAYDDDEFDLAYLREDLRGEYGPSDFETFRHAVFESERALGAANRERIGERIATVHVFENAYALRISVPDHTGGVVASLDFTVGTELHEFVTNCRERAVRALEE